MATRERPLSPFMLGQTYRFQITSLMSILHRISGIALVFGAFGLAWWLLRMASGGDRAITAAVLMASPLGKFALFGFTLALMYHLFNGIRHLMWDAGFGFDIPDVYKTGYAVAILSVLATALIWAGVLLGGGV